MSAETVPDMLDPEDLNPTDRLCIRVLREGRASPAYIADVGGYSTGNVRTQLKHLASHDHVVKIYDGLYQLVDDPLGGNKIDVGPEVEQRLAEDRVDDIADNDIPEDPSAGSGGEDLAADPMGERRETGEQSGDSASKQTSDEIQSAPGQNGAADLEAAYREYLADRPPKKSHAKDIVVDALLLLRDRDEMETGDLQDELFPKYEEHYSTDRTMWNAISRYLKDLAGFVKSDDYGGWAYAGDDAVWKEITDD